MAYAYVFNHEAPEAIWPTHIVRENVFTREECAQILAPLDDGTAQGARATIREGRDIVPAIRASRVHWLPMVPVYAWIWHRLAEVCLAVNQATYQFELTGFVDMLQVTTYTATEAGHYTWHMDCGPGHMRVRKLSLSIQLSHPLDYDGGLLELHHGATYEAMSKRQGTAIVFPAYALHRVTPVTRGTRHALVAWCCGHGPYR
jgi:PKHD-type hydroxylase